MSLSEILILKITHFLTERFYVKLTKILELGVNRDSQSRTYYILERNIFPWNAKNCHREWIFHEQKEQQNFKHSSCNFESRELIEHKKKLIYSFLTSSNNMFLLCNLLFTNCHIFSTGDFCNERVLSLRLNIFSVESFE